MSEAARAKAKQVEQEARLLPASGWVELFSQVLDAFAAEQTGRLKENYDEYLKESAAALRQVQQAKIDAEAQVERLRGERDYWRGIAQSLLAAPTVPPSGEPR